MSRTVWLVTGALILLGAAIALVLLLGSSDDASSPAASSEPQAQAPKVTPPPIERNPSVTVTDSERPRMPADSTPAATPPSEYAVGDVRVRDHRAGDHAPLDIPPNIHPAEGRLIPATLTQAISRKVKDVMRECLQDLPAESKGERPKVEGQVIIAIKDKQLSVTQSVMQLRDVTGERVQAVKACIESRSIGVSTEATDQADLESYSINISYGFR